MATQQVFSEQEVDFGTSQKKLLWNWSGDNSKVPPGRTLDVTTCDLQLLSSRRRVSGQG